MAKLARGSLVLLAGFLATIALAGELPTQRLIVKLRDDGLMQKRGVSVQSRITRLAADVNVAVHEVRPTVAGAHILALEKRLSMPQARAIAARMAADPDVEYVEPDRWYKPAKVPSDEFVSELTYLTNDPAAINAYAAWDITTGSENTVVAIVDTGIRPHADLTGRILPGYDFISDPAVANDGDGPDSDASDPGDWIADADLAGYFKDLDCVKQNSTWHGTAVSGIVAANPNNGAWSAGIDWTAKILPVRVLGKCGGYFSDIMLGVAWAAGLPLEGAPINPTPAHVINLSLGGDGPCTQFEQTVIAGALATGNVKAIVAAAGNDNADLADHAPANCPSVIAVASTTSRGNRAAYSNHGAGITISAPGGQYNPRAHTDGIVVLSNNGVTMPATDGFRDEGGTSFAAPMVSGVVSLMLSVAPNLTADQVRSILVSNAKPFPSGSACNTAICGAGIVDAEASVKAAQAAADTGFASRPIDVIEFYNATLDHYFISDDAGEISDLDAGLHVGWTRTGLAFKAYSAPNVRAHPVCRFYISPPHGDSHFFSASIEECAAVGANSRADPNDSGVVYESPNAFYIGLPDLDTGACAAGTVAVYRLWNNRVDSNHRYTIDYQVKAEMMAKGYLEEGYGPDAVVMCASQ